MPSVTDMSRLAVASPGLGGVLNGRGSYWDFAVTPATGRVRVLLTLSTGLPSEVTDLVAAASVCNTFNLQAENLFCLVRNRTLEVITPTERATLDLVASQLNWADSILLPLVVAAGQGADVTVALISAPLPE